MMNGDLIPPNEKETGRLEAFSDGIFAIAITLLGLTLQVPDLGADISAAALAEALGLQWPSYIAFAISFFTILIVWLNHHAVFGLVHRADFLFLLTNGFLLMLVTVVPITTEVANRYLALGDVQPASAQAFDPGILRQNPDAQLPARATALLDRHRPGVLERVCESGALYPPVVDLGAYAARAARDPAHGPPQDRRRQPMRFVPPAGPPMPSRAGGQRRCEVSGT
jgi:hypothetical protein